LLSFLVGPLSSAEMLIKSSSDAGLIMQLIDVITTTGPERNDLVFGLVLVGMAWGSGIWIGWELMKYVWSTIHRLWRLITVGPEEPKSFKRPHAESIEKASDR
jgi:hypothetical protein